MTEKGFSLVEVMIVLAIIAVAGMIVIPRFTDSVKVVELNNAAYQLAADLRLQQQMTINAEVLTSDNNNRIIPVMFFKKVSPYGYYISVNNKVIKNVNFPMGIELNVNSSIQDIHFGINGNITVPRTITLKMGNNYRNIIIDVIGRVRIEEYKTK